MNLDRIIDKSLDHGDLASDEIAALYRLPLFSPESLLVQVASRDKSMKACAGKAEVHAQVGLNVAPCPRNCRFCAFAACNHVFDEAVELSADQVVERSREFETDGANAVFLMTTAQYPFAKFIEIAREVRGALRPETVLVANVGDVNREQAFQLEDCGFSGIYHAVRLGEGRDTRLDPGRRIRTMHFAREAGLSVGTCVEPVGTEHTVEELVEKTIITRDVRPAYSGAARRIPIPGTEMAHLGIVSEARMAHILAVVRLALGHDIPGNCTHEPNVIGAAAGANLIWAESGSNPRDTEEDTEGCRGMTVAQCRKVLAEAEWDVLDGPSRFYTNGRR